METLSLTHFDPAKESDLSLSIVVPVYNEEECVSTLLQEIVAVVGQDPSQMEILFINDGSTDQTASILHEAKKRCPALQVISFEQNAGQSAAMACGFQIAKGRYVVALDGDGQNDPADIPRMVELLEKYQVVCGIRRKRKDRWTKRLGSKIANFIRRKVTGDSIVDIGCSLKAFHREPLQKIYYFNGVHRFLPILLEMGGCSIIQIEVNHRSRSGGTSKYTNFGRLLKTWQDLFGVRWMQKRKLNYQIKNPKF